MVYALHLLGAILRAGFEPPASWLGLCGLIVVGAILFFPLEPFAEGWYVPALITLAAWLGMAATQVEPADYRRLLRYGKVWNDPYFRRALERRDTLAAELKRLTITNVRVDVEVMLHQIDQELLPELAVRVQRHRTLVRGLQEEERGLGPLLGASEESITALRDFAEQQRKAIEGFLTRLSDMNANLIGLTHETEQVELEQSPKEWAEELGAYWQATAEVFRPTGLLGTGEASLPASGPPSPRRRRRRREPPPV